MVARAVGLSFAIGLASFGLAMLGVEIPTRAFWLLVPWGVVVAAWGRLRGLSWRAAVVYGAIAAAAVSLTVVLIVAFIIVYVCGDSGCFS